MEGLNLGRFVFGLWSGWLFSAVYSCVMYRRAALRDITFVCVARLGDWLGLACSFRLRGGWDYGGCTMIDDAMGGGVVWYGA